MFSYQEAVYILSETIVFWEELDAAELVFPYSVMNLDVTQ